MSSRLGFLLVVSSLLAACHRNSHHGGTATEAGDPAEVVNGERLFLETRFAQFFAANMIGGDVNVPLADGDPTMDTIVHANGSTFAGPFAGLSMNCRQCHLVDELVLEAGAGMRTYTEFSRRPAIPDRGDGRATAPRNSPPLVNAFIARSVDTFLHFDGEFVTIADLVRGTITGRNYGWNADEAAAALAHLAKVIREDDGSGALAAEFGGLAYADVFAGAANVPAAFRLPPAFQIDVTTATDQQILDGVAALIVEYVNGLEFVRDENGEFDTSPFDVFLAKNGLPRQPDPGESDLDFSRRLRGNVNSLVNPLFVDETDATFTFHDHDFQFGATELSGLKVFLAEPSSIPPPPGEIVLGGKGNCIQCHPAPAFTDFLLHNIGTTQLEYDNIHGTGTFAALAIPDLTTRNGDPAQFLPPSAALPAAEGVFLRVPDAGDPRFTDLGVWNVLANPNMPTPQATLHDAIAIANGLPTGTADDVLLPLTIATFKTPGLRDLSHGGPYMHTGQFDEIEDVLGHYLLFSAIARVGNARNSDPQLSGIALVGSDLVTLAAFLRSLDEDYE